MNNNKTAFLRKRNNKWFVYVEYLDEETQKRKQKNCGSYENKKDAEIKLIEIKNDINKDKFTAPRTISFVDRCTQYYLEETKAFSPTTIKRYKGVVNNYVKNYFKETKLCDINVSNYQKFINYLCITNLKGSTIKEIVNKTNAILRECYRLKEISENIPDFIIIPKKNDMSNDDMYTVEEAKKILSESYTISSLEIPIHLFLLAGLRFGEMAGLLWENVDFDNNILEIKNNLVYVNGVYYLRKTKTDGSTREITVPSAVMKLLKQEKIRQNKLKVQSLLKNEWAVVCINEC